MGASILEYRLTSVASRLHRLRVLRRQTVCWLLVIVPAIALCLMLPGHGLPLRRESLSLIVACGVALVLARWKLSVPGWLEIARLVEQHNPGLNDIVLTAVRQRDRDSQISPLLAQRVLKEADEVALVADWTSVVSTRQIILWFMASLVSFAVLVSAVIGAGSLLPPPVGSTATPGPGSAADLTTVTVEPGDTEVERGSGLTIVARFSGMLPTHAAVLFRADEETRTGREPTMHSMAATVDAGVLTTRLPSLDGDGSYTVVFGYGDVELSEESTSTESWRITTFVRPRVMQVDARVTPPEWTGREPQTVEDTRRVTAIEGSEVALRVYVNKPVAVRHLLSTNGEQHPLSADAASPLLLKTVLTADQDSDRVIVLEDEQGRSALDDTVLHLRIIRNEPPVIRIRFPQPDQSVSALQELFTEAEAVDDFGIVDYGITWALSGQEPQTLSLDQDDSASDLSVAMAHTIDLESLQAQPNDLLTWHFYADTYVADGQLHRTLSDLMFADVRRFEEIFREGQQQQGGQAGQGGGSPTDDLLQVQRQIAIALWNVQRDVNRSPKYNQETATASVNTILESQQLARTQLQTVRDAAPVDPAIAEAIAEADDFMLDVVEALDSWSADRPEPTLTDASVNAQGAFRQLLRLRAAEHEVQRSSSQGGQGSGRNSAMQRQMDQLELDNDRNRYETEQQAQNQPGDEQGEQLQILNRLKELARRQNMLNERLKQLESERRDAQSDEERERIERELKRLRDEQQDLLRDIDEVRERMEQSPERNASQQQQFREDVDRARQNVRNSSRALDEGNLARALSEGTRAERQFDELQEEFRNQTSSAFSEAARQLRQQARDLSERQEEIRKQLPGNRPQSSTETDRSAPRSLRSERPEQQIHEQLQQQTKDLEKILEQSRELVEQAESSEPLLAGRLYETIQQVRELRTEDALRTAEFLVERGLWNQVKRPEEAARRGIEALREGVEQAAEAVLGSEEATLQRARSTIEQLSEELAEELAANTGEPHRNSPASPAEQDSGDGSPPQRGSEPSSPESASQESASSPEASAAAPGQNAPADSPASARPSASTGRPSDSPSNSESGEQQTPALSVLQCGGRESGGTGGHVHRPLTGRDFADWSDRLRDVEEILDDPELRQQVAQVRDRARAMRRDYQRHGTEPQWDLVESTLLNEMQKLHRRLSQEIAALQTDHSMVPIDREPVPDTFDELVQRYYELLGQERQESAP